MPTNEFIDLGCGLDSPSTSMASPMPPKKSYPCFYFTCDESIDLPEGDFTFMAKGRCIKKTEEKRDAKEPRYSYEVEVQGFKPMAGKKSEGMASMADAFKERLNKSMGKKMSGEYPEGEED